MAITTAARRFPASYRAPGTVDLTITGFPKRMTPSGFFLHHVDLLDTEAGKQAFPILSPILDAGERKLWEVPLPVLGELSKDNHNNYLDSSDRPLITNPDRCFVDVRRIFQVQEKSLIRLYTNLAPCLTSKGRDCLDNIISGKHIDKAFLLPVHVFSGKAEKFLRFFGKTSPAAIAELERLIEQKDGKKKIVNNQAMPWDKDSFHDDRGLGMMEWIEFVYRDRADEMKAFEAKQQYNGMLTSCLIVAALEKGWIGPEEVAVVTHDVWSTQPNNSWQPAARKFLVELGSVEIEKDLAQIRKVLLAGYETLWEQKIPKDRNLVRPELRAVVDAMKSVFPSLKADSYADYYEEMRALF